MTPTPPRDRLAKLERALNTVSAALRSGQPQIIGDDTVYPLDGALVGNTLNDVRAALTILAEMRADMVGLAEPVRAEGQGWVSWIDTQNRWEHRCAAFVRKLLGSE